MIETIINHLSVYNHINQLIYLDANPLPKPICRKKFIGTDLTALVGEFTKNCPQPPGSFQLQFQLHSPNPSNPNKPLVFSCSLVQQAGWKKHGHQFPSGCRRHLLSADAAEFQKPSQRYYICRPHKNLHSPIPLARLFHV